MMEKRDQKAPIDEPEVQAAFMRQITSTSHFQSLKSAVLAISERNDEWRRGMGLPGGIGEEELNDIRRCAIYFESYDPTRGFIVSPDQFLAIFYELMALRAKVGQSVPARDRNDDVSST